ncbi:hypothetical protein [Pseudaestuariivita sp.]|uniref:hypothetical protein n=1 Tax=Pseudaestuariivita sp. TaxID=2211669 RepID=UPI00405A4880
MAEQKLVLEILKDIQARMARNEEKLDTLVRRMSTNEEAVANTQRSVDDLGRWLDDLIKAADLDASTG